LKKLKISFALIFVAGFIALIATESVAYPPFLFKARKFGAKDCTFCHINAEGGPPWNDRGKWLIQEKEKRKADQVDVEWLAEYKPGNDAAEKPGAAENPGAAPIKPPAELQQFLTLEEDWMKAVARGDQDGLNRLMAGEFTLTSAYSTGDLITRDEFLKNIQSVKQRELIFYNATVGIYGDVAILKARIKDNYTMNGEDRSGDYLITDVWVKRDGRWQIVTRHSSLPMKAQTKG
jgi:ketosteroid isomerase-like protein